nr:MAG: hypothetical protein 3 [Luteoviridae sp.]
MVTKTKTTKRRLNKAANFGAVSSISTAPVSIGNSVRGSKPRIKQTIDGARIAGRDFAFALSGTGSAVTNWELIGGMPITPCVLPSSVLRNYCQMFQFFKVHKIVAHYITSSPTSQAGDVVFYYERDRNAPMCDYSNSNFLPYVLSDESTIIGPQWMNHSALVLPPPEWKTTLYGSQTDLNEDAAGTLFLFSKTNAINSPGYMIIDYDISFKSMAVNPRAGLLPISRGQSSFICFYRSSGSWTAGNAFTITDVTSGKTIANQSSVAPTGAVSGDIYKVVLQATASIALNTWTGSPTPSLSNLLRYSDDTTISLDDGFTMFTRFDGTTWYFYPTVDSAVADANKLEYQTSETTPTIGMSCELQLVRNIDVGSQSSY